MARGVRGEAEGRQDTVVRAAELRSWGAGIEVTGVQGQKGRGVWTAWLGVQGVQDTTARGAEQRGKGVQDRTGRVQGGVQGTSARV